MVEASVGVICDLKEERWTSMDLVAEMLLEHLPGATDNIEPVRVQPPLRRRFSADETGPAESGWGRRRFNADRALNRFWDYPRMLAAVRPRHDVFHVVDHSYAHLVHALPPRRTIVTCHDLHTFKCLLDGEGEGESRSRPFRWMAAHVLSGLRKAPRVAVDTAAIGEALVANEIVPRDRITVVPLGVDTVFCDRPDTKADAEADALLAGPEGSVDILHVGGTFQRKRLDLVLSILHRVRQEIPAARLIRAGGQLTSEQARLAEELGVRQAIVSLPFIGRDVLAAVYRRAALVVLPSEDEGFGFPVIEAMRCGVPVIASDLQVLREVGGDAAEFRPIADVAAWSDAVLELIRERERRPERWAERRAMGIRHASTFSWHEYARRMAELYNEVMAS